MQTQMRMSMRVHTCTHTHTHTHALMYVYIYAYHCIIYIYTLNACINICVFSVSVPFSLLQASPRKQYFGCAWFSLWQRKTLEAVKCGCNLLVVTKRDGTLGNSQQGEVRYLQQNAWPYSEMNILDFLMYFAATAPKDQKVLVSRKLQGSVNRCRRAKAETSNRVQSLKLEHQATKQGAQHRVCVDPWTLFWWWNHGLKTA